MLKRFVRSIFFNSLCYYTILYFDVFIKKTKIYLKLKAPLSKQHPYYSLAAFRITKTQLLHSSAFLDQTGKFWGGGGGGGGGAPIKFQLNASERAICPGIKVFFQQISKKAAENAL